MQAPEPDTKPPAVKGPNSFRLLVSMMSAAAGIRANSARGRGFADASIGAILGALLILCAALGIGGYAFIHAIRIAVAN